MPDTSEMLTEKDYSDLKDIQSIKKKISAYINMEELVNVIRDIIDKSECVDFKNERSKKFIDIHRPSLNLVINLEKSLEKEEYNKTYPSSKKFSSKDKEISFYSNILFNEVSKKITSYILGIMHNKPELHDFIVTRDIFKDCTEEEKEYINVAPVLSTIFGMIFSENNPSNVIMQVLF